MSEPEDIEIYEQALTESVHFSLKTINSNIPKGGIRLSHSQAIDLPYISARTLLNDGITIPTDYQANAGKTATIFKIIKAAMLDEDTSDTDEQTQITINALKPKIHQTFDTPYQSGLEHIDVRMRQLLLPKEDGYIAISPMTAAGVNYYLNEAVDDIKEMRKDDEQYSSELNNIRTAVFGIGGANPQNVGSLVRSMQRPIYLEAPKLDEDIRIGFSIFYKGIDYYIPNKVHLDKKLKPALLEWSELLVEGLIKTEQNNYQGWYDDGIQATKNDIYIRQTETVFLNKIIRSVLAQGRDAYQKLLAVEDKLPKFESAHDPQNTENGIEITHHFSPLFHPNSSVTFVIQGLIDPTIRNDLWLREFSKDLAKKIVGSKINGVAFQLDNDAITYLQRRIQDLLFKELA